MNKKTKYLDIEVKAWLQMDFPEWTETLRMLQIEAQGGLRQSLFYSRHTALISLSSKRGSQTCYNINTRFSEYLLKN